MLTNMGEQGGKMKEKPQRNEGKNIERNSDNTKWRFKALKCLKQFCELDRTEALEDSSECDVSILVGRQVPPDGKGEEQCR